MHGPVYLLTGSNVGQSLLYLQHALLQVEDELGAVTKASAIYKTDPWGNTQQNAFYNQVIEIYTDLAPDELMRKILNLEQQMGRIRTTKWAPRIIDIDILFYQHVRMNTPLVQLPHPLLHERRFTLVPLSEIIPNFIHPVLKQNITELLHVCPDKGLVEKL